MEPPGRGDSHRLSVSIAEALVENRIVEPGKLNEVAKIVALKIELQNAFGVCVSNGSRAG